MTRDLGKNSKKSKRELERAIERVYKTELQQTYRQAYRDVRSELTRLLTVAPGDLTRAQRAQLLRNANVLLEIQRVMEVPIRETQRFIEEVTRAAFDGAYLRAGWSVDQATGVELGWGVLNENAVKAAVGITDDFAALGGVMDRAEVTKHALVLRDAFRNYSADTRRWIGRAVSEGVVKGESIPEITRRLRDGLDKSYRAAETIARTETLRSMGVGSQIAYDDAADKGVQIRQVWDATLDMRTRPAHAEMDGRVRDEETGLFAAPWGATPGPHRNGIAAQDINCRCDVVPEVAGFEPQLRRIRGEGLVRNKTFTKWAVDNNIVNRPGGSRYKFVTPVEL
jgi:SPP1 gp7 family putative phage head morphogenesis protein